MDSLVSNDLPGFENSRLMTLGSMVRPEDTVGLIIETGYLTSCFAGTFPTELLSSSGTLEHLSLTRNFFHGSLPTEIGLLSTLSSLDLSHNDFHGSIPSTLEEMTAMRTLGKFDGWVLCLGSVSDSARQSSTTTSF